VSEKVERDYLKISGIAFDTNQKKMCAPGSKPLYKRKGSYRSLTVAALFYRGSALGSAYFFYDRYTGEDKMSATKIPHSRL